MSAQDAGPWRGIDREERVARFTGTKTVYHPDGTTTVTAMEARVDAIDIELFNRDQLRAGSSDPFGVRLEERMTQATQERTQTQGTEQGMGQTRQLNSATAFPEGGYGATYDGQPVAVIATGFVDGLSPAHLIVEQSGTNRWVSQSKVSFTDAALQDTISRSRSNR